MEAGFMVITFVAVGIAFALGYLLGRSGVNRGVQGTVYIVTDEYAAKSYPYLESNVLMEELASMSQAVFNIKTIRQDSHE